MSLTVMGEEEREWVDNLLEASYRDIEDHLNIEEDSQVFEVMRESLKRLEEVL